VRRGSTFHSIDRGGSQEATVTTPGAMEYLDGARSSVENTNTEFPELRRIHDRSFFALDRDPHLSATEFGRIHVEAVSSASVSSPGPTETNEKPTPHGVCLMSSKT
jgi:hypothetical protein